MFPARGEFSKLGKGSLMLDLLTAAGVATGFQFMGNATGISIQSEITQVEKYSSTQGSAGLVNRDKVRTAYTLTGTFDEWTMTNLKLFLGGELTDRSQASASSVTFTIEDVKVGRYYDVGKRQITSVVATDGSDILVLNTDYSLNSEFGIVQILAGGSVVDGEDLVVTFNHPAINLDVIRIGRNQKQIAHLLYLADDSNSDGDAVHDRLEVWKVDVAPEGELQFISDEYGGFQLTMAVLDDGTNHPSDPYGTLERVRA